MKNRASAAPIFAAPRAARSTPWTERLMLRVLGLPSEEEAERILRNRPGFFSSMTPEQRAALGTFDGPEVLGPANGPTRTF
jgi:hypothetical protein